MIDRGKITDQAEDRLRSQFEKVTRLDGDLANELLVGNGLSVFVTDSTVGTWANGGLTCLEAWQPGVDRKWKAMMVRSLNKAGVA